MMACARCGCTEENPCIVHPVQGRMGLLRELAGKRTARGLELDPVALEGLAVSGVDRCFWVGMNPPTCSACVDDEGRAPQHGGSARVVADIPLLYDAYGRPLSR